MSEQSREVRRVRRMLRDLGQMAQEASLTGSFQDGARSAVSQYNRVLDHLAQIGETPGTLFGRLDENATFDEVGVAARQLASFLEEDEDDGRGKHKGAAHGGHNNVHINVGSLDELKDLGRVIRESMPEWLREKIPAPPEPPEPPNGGNLSEIESRLAEVGAKLQAVAEQLRRGDLTDAQRAELAERLSQLGQEQANLARQHAALREREAAV